MADPELVKMLDDLGINTVDYRGTDKATRHNYTEAFAELLAPYRKKQCSLLEIGTRAGGSAVLWRNYLPEAHLDLVDLRFRFVPENLERLDNFEFHQLDAYTSEAVKNFYGKKFDIIIDDGSHKRKDLIFAAANYFPLLAPGGVLILEDIPNERLLPDLADLFTPEQQKRIRVFDMRASGRYDDVIWSIRQAS